jgi:hypothetical protein
VTAPPLTDADRRIIARARELAELPADANCAYTGEADEASARAAALGTAKYLLGELAAIADRFGTGGAS